MKILRVFPERTSMTPTDDLVRIGEPDLLPIPVVDEVHVSCVFTWRLARCRQIADAWRARLPGIPVLTGGPAFGDPGAWFIPGRYLKTGITITSRGCLNRCQWCYVPRREGGLRTVPITPGHTIQDNNLLACPEPHFAAVCRMLGRQSKGARFAGGFEARCLRAWHLRHLWPLSIAEIWLACDTPAALPALHSAAMRLAKLPSLATVAHPRKKLRCYVLIGRGGETLDDAEARLESVWRAGCLPFAQLYRDDKGIVQASREWRDLARKWSRPAIMVTAHKERKGGK